MCTTETFVRGDLVLSHLGTYKQAAELWSHLCDLMEASVGTSVLEFCGHCSRFHKNSSSCICTSWSSLMVFFSKPCEKPIAVVSPAGDKGMNEFSQSCFDTRPLSLALYLTLVKSFSNCFNMVFTQVWNCVFSFKSFRVKMTGNPKSLLVISVLPLLSWRKCPLSLVLLIPNVEFLVTERICSACF